MKISSLLNISLCEFYNKNWPEVRLACDEVIKLDKKNVKAYYRKARSYLDNPASLMDDYLKARECLEKAFNIDNSNNDVKVTLDNLNAYIQKEKRDEKKIFKSFYRNVNYKYIEEEKKKKEKAKDENDPLSGKAQIRMLDLILEMCHVQLDIYDRQGNKSELKKLERTIEKAKNYREDLENLIDIDFNNPNEKIKKFAEKEGLDLKDPTIQESINGIKKKYINEINEFHQSNLMLMQQTNENNKKNLEELKMRKREHKEQLKQKKKLSEKKAPKGKNIKQESKSKFNYKIMIIAFIILSSITLFRYGIKYYIQHNEY